MHRCSGDSALDNAGLSIPRSTRSAHPVPKPVTRLRGRAFNGHGTFARAIVDFGVDLGGRRRCQLVGQRHDRLVYGCGYRRAPATKPTALDHGRPLVAYATYPIGDRRRNDFHRIATIVAVGYFGRCARPSVAQHWSSSSLNSKATVARKKLAIGPHYHQLQRARSRCHKLTSAGRFRPGFARKLYGLVATECGDLCRRHLQPSTQHDGRPRRHLLGLALVWRRTWPLDRLLVAQASPEIRVAHAELVAKNGFPAPGTHGLLPGVRDPGLQDGPVVEY